MNDIHSMVSIAQLMFNCSQIETFGIYIWPLGQEREREQGAVDCSKVLLNLKSNICHILHLSIERIICATYKVQILGTLLNHLTPFLCR